jgi:hypothetical protein
MAAQAAPQASTRNGWIDKLTRDRQQVVGGQQQGLAQLNHDQFLLWCERRFQRLWTMRTIVRAVAILPFPDRLPRDFVEPGQFGLRQRRFLDFLADQVGRSCLSVKCLGHQATSERSDWNSVRKTCLALRSGQLRMGT